MNEKQPLQEPRSDENLIIFGAGVLTHIRNESEVWRQNALLTGRLQVGTDQVIDRSPRNHPAVRRATKKP